MEWPPKSAKQVEFPEVDRAAFFHLVPAKKKMNSAQVALILELERLLAARQGIISSWRQ